MRPLFVHSLRNAERHRIHRRSQAPITPKTGPYSMPIHRFGRASDVADTLRAYGRASASSSPRRGDRRRSRRDPSPPMTGDVPARPAKAATSGCAPKVRSAPRGDPQAALNEFCEKVCGDARRGRGGGGVAKGTIYLNFKDKQALFESLSARRSLHIARSKRYASKAPAYARYNRGDRPRSIYRHKGNFSDYRMT